MNKSAVALWSLAMSSAACSFTGLDDVPVPACTSSAQCEGLNAKRGISPAACERYQCTEGLCRFGPRDEDGDGDPSPSCGGADCDESRAAVHTGATESCDGLDNNCDGVVDEGVTTLRNTRAIETNLSYAGDVAVASPTAGTVGIAMAGPQLMTRFHRVTDVQPPQSLSLPFLQQMDANSLTSASTMAGCPLNTTTGCNFNEMAVAPIAESPLWLAAVVSTGGCAKGQLRLGYFDPDGSTGVVLRGPAARSNVFGGVDVDDAMSRCTGLHRAAGPRGAARPAIASVGGSNPQGLAVWLGDEFSRAECAGTVVDVEALGVWLESSASPPVRWVNATNNGTPFSVGRTFAGTPPSVLASRDGYVVAFAGLNGNANLAHVPALPSPPAFDAGTAVASQARPTAALTAEEPFSIPRQGTDPVSQVVVAARVAGSIDALAVVWREGCDSAAATLWFAPVTYSAATHAFAAGTPVQLSPPARIRSPSLTFVQSGFVRETYARSGATAGANTGGWVATWTAGEPATRVMVRRVAAFDNAPLESAPVVAATGDALAQPVVYAGSATTAPLLTVHREPLSNQLMGSELLCRPAP